MTRPTPEQIAKARTRVDALLSMGDVPMNYISDVMTLLAATEPPTDKEVTLFAVDYYVQHEIGSESVRNAGRIAEYMHDMPASRAAAMRAAICHFLGTVKP